MGQNDAKVERRSKEKPEKKNRTSVSRDPERIFFSFSLSYSFQFILNSLPGCPL